MSRDRFLTIRHERPAVSDTRVPDTHQDRYSATVLGFWMYLMTDCLLFATLFCTYAVLHNNTFGGPSSRDLFNLTTAFMESMILLVSSVTCGIAMLYALKNDRMRVIAWLGATAILGFSFLVMEMREFHHLVQEGNSWRRSAFLSSFFTLVGTHGTHITVGLGWMLVLMVQVFVSGINVDTFRRLVVLSLFWHFLDLIWIFIFTFVYLMGVL